jgi:predicted short-subunit dehydrogenase-like oxidoreductase (DUF2520 family)
MRTVERTKGMRAVIVGRGRVGRGLHQALTATAFEARLVRGRGGLALPNAELVILAIPDPALAAVAEALVLDRGASVVHCSGSFGPEVLARCRARGVSVGAMHPLASFADPKRPPALTGTSFVIDGDRRAVGAAKRVARALGARAVVAPVHGPGYHAAAALSANGAAALAAVAVRVMGALGLRERDAQRAIGALLRTVGENVERVGVPGALSGPVIRGDDATVTRHRAALASIDPDARAAYDAVAPAILDCAVRAGLSEERASAVRRALRGRGRG